jgi:pimeloyl-ACP methyl ester carboxylesterase
VDTPVLLFIGRNDVLSDAARNVASIVPGSRIEVVEGSDHNAYLEHIDVFLDLVGEHISCA